MSKAQQRRYFNSAGDHQKAILGILQAIGRSRGLDRVWSDWIEISAIALAKLDLRQADTREDRYRQIMSLYDKQEAQQLAEAFAHLVMAFEKSQTTGEFGDLLGSTFMMLDMGISHNGQFFTPYEVSRLMGMMLMGDGQELAQKAADRGFIRLMEPACGAGSMIIAAAQTLNDAGVNYQNSMHAVAIDIDRRCAHMTFLQLALLHIPAQVIHGNALSGQAWEHWYTPAHIMGGWSARLRQRDEEDAAAAKPTSDAARDSGPATALPAQNLMPLAVRAAAHAGQMTLF
ncbi:N-6 DNA methylase [Bordetella sp. FB-8]|uniref:N-6 DNA methylase n=1 Tax=Bordetella sp. FB-8 TaxID=1159870 RepID=UPI000375E4B0|nr:N-6 DNA methylase [Bordetella sp. FB-8]